MKGLDVFTHLELDALNVNLRCGDICAPAVRKMSLELEPIC